SNDTAVQRRAGEGAKRPTRPSDCNGGVAGAHRLGHDLQLAPSALWTPPDAWGQEECQWDRDRKDDCPGPRQDPLHLDEMEALRHHQSNSDESVESEKRQRPPIGDRGSMPPTTPAGVLVTSHHFAAIRPANDLPVS